MHHLVFAANPPRKRAAKRRTGKMPAALKAYWDKKNRTRKNPMKKSRKARRIRATRRKARRIVRRSPRRRVHRRRHHRRVRATRRRPARRKSHRRARYKYVIRHAVKRVRVNPSHGKMLPLIGGGAAALFALPMLNAKIIPASTSTSKFSMQNLAAAAEGFALFYLLRRKYPNLAKGILYGGIASSALAISGVSIPGLTSTAQANPAGTGGTSPGGTGSTAMSAMPGRRMAAYLGRGQRRRRMGAYLGGPNQAYRKLKQAMNMKQYLSPGQPIQSLIGPVSPARKTFAHQAGNLSGMYTSGPAFAKDAWAR
jgi:hypothetical protein